MIKWVTQFNNGFQWEFRKIGLGLSELFLPPFGDSSPSLATLEDNLVHMYVGLECRYRSVNITSGTTFIQGNILKFYTHGTLHSSMLYKYFYQKWLSRLQIPLIFFLYVTLLQILNNIFGAFVEIPQLLALESFNWFCNRKLVKYSVQCRIFCYFFINFFLWLIQLFIPKENIFFRL